MGFKGACPLQLLIPLWGREGVTLAQFPRQLKKREGISPDFLVIPVDRVFF